MLTVRQVARIGALFLGYALVSALIAAPVAFERAVEGARFEDRLGTLPVEVSLAHDGRSTLDTGILGKLYWDRTGTAGFGAVVRATGTPEAGGTLSSYVDQRFVQANVEIVGEPGKVAEEYGAELGARLWDRFLEVEVAAGLVGGAALLFLFRAGLPFPGLGKRRRIAVVVAAVVVPVAVSTLVATIQFDEWDGSSAPGAEYPMPGVDGLSFSSPEVLELARQIEPFIAKNTERVEERTSEYVEQVEVTAPPAISAAADLGPRDGEVIVIAEADPQGSSVGTRAREQLYGVLVEELGADAFAARTISGDITSNGTVAERGFVETEADASPGIPTVVVKGDHDTEITMDQVSDSDMVNPDLETSEVNDLRFTAGNDPAFKTLFGGVVVNETGVSEAELGQMLREEVDQADPVVVLFHQPRSVLGYLGTDRLPGPTPTARLTTPYDDGIPDLPPGIINVGHLHDAEPPRVIWNTDTDDVTWTVVNQLGTSGGVEERPTFNRFSTPFSTPLKPISVQLQYVDTETGLQTGYVEIEIATDGTVSVSDRVDLGALDARN